MVTRRVYRPEVSIDAIGEYLDIACPDFFAGREDKKEHMLGLLRETAIEAGASDREITTRMQRAIRARGFTPT